MDTPEIVRRLLSRPVTKERALKVLHLLENASQLQDVINHVEILANRSADVVTLADTLTESVVAAHFARRTY